MSRGFEIPKAAPEAVARAVLDGVTAGHDDIATDPMSSHVLETFVRDPRAVERQFAG
jgi:hypothetical protein